MKKTSLRDRIYFVSEQDKKNGNLLKLLNAY
jgi:hypothetical protein